MSHQMRTPLTGIIGTTELLKNTNLSLKQKDFVNTIRISGENLKETLNELLDYSKIEAGMVKLKPVVIKTSQLFDHAQKHFRSICHKKIEWITLIDESLPPYLKVDFHLINQIFNNLIYNAVKFTHKGKITLIAQKDSNPPQGGLMVKVKVIDTGIGIKPEMQKDIFKPIAQGDLMEAEDTQDFESMGLGLPICKELASQLQGEIGLESEPGKGSTFWFTFLATTATKAEYPEEKLPDEDRNAGKKLNILLVEDKIVNQKVIKLILSSMGHTVSIANHGEEALQQVKPGKFDLILMDIKMPVMDGITATQKLKEKYKNLPPIVGLSANAFEGDRERYMALGMDEYLTKPVSSKDFYRLTNLLF